MTDNQNKSEVKSIVTIKTERAAQIATPIEPSFGWNTYAETVNGRFAMLGFVVLLLLELVTGQDLWTWLGLR
jgi:Chlorophyll A-B binding protein